MLSSPLHHRWLRPFFSLRKNQHGPTLPPFSLHLNFALSPNPHTLAELSLICTAGLSQDFALSPNPHTIAKLSLICKVGLSQDYIAFRNPTTSRWREGRGLELTSREGRGPELVSREGRGPELYTTLVLRGAMRKCREGSLASEATSTQRRGEALRRRKFKGTSATQ